MIGRQPFFPKKRRREPPVPPRVEAGRSRLLITGALFSAAFLVVSARLVGVTMFVEKSQPQYSRSVSKPAFVTGRANIVDRNGNLLATSLKTASLYANPRVMLDAREAVNKLANVLPELDRRALHAKLTQDRSFIWVRRHLTPRQKYEVNRLGIPGLDFRDEERRVYPSAALVSHILGHTDIDNRGLAGIERHFDRKLQSDKSPLNLSIDIRVQHAMRQELATAVREFHGIGAAGIVMDVRNGEVISMVSLPDFDPNLPADIQSDTRFNRATLGVYEMGSTFKIFNTAMALDSGIVTIRDGYDATKPIKVSRFIIRDFHAKRRWLSVPEIFMYSSNIGSVKMALEVGVTRQRAFLQKIGILHPSPVEISEIGAPLIPGRWREINAMTISFGHGLSVSPMQLVAGVGAMVNGGIYHAPTFLKKPSGSKNKGRRVISAKTSDRIRRLLRLVVAKGTGSKAAAEGFLVGGKTGTAEKVVGRRYKKKALMSSFVGAFPMNAPRYIVFAMIDEPTGTEKTFGYATGGWVAAPVVGKVISRIGPILGVKTVDESAPAIEREMAIDIITKQKGKRRLASF
tara:strand:+ start:72980 stop:74698 length:1719 start_codon:yes stop_codon:yes gene_type:complete